MTPMATNSNLPWVIPRIIKVTLDEKALRYIHHFMDMLISVWPLMFNPMLWLHAFNE